MYNKSLWIWQELTFSNDSKSENHQGIKSIIGLQSNYTLKKIKRNMHLDIPVILQFAFSQWRGFVLNLLLGCACFLLSAWWGRERWSHLSWGVTDLKSLLFLKRFAFRKEELEGWKLHRKMNTNFEKMKDEEELKELRHKLEQGHVFGPWL